MSDARAWPRKISPTAPKESARRAEGLKALPLDDRPRERLLRCGSAVLSDAELLAVLLRTGRPGQSALAMGRELLDERDGLSGLLAAAPEELRRRGLGNAKLATLLAAFELGRRLARARIPERQPMERPEMVAEYLLLRYGQEEQEIVGALHLDIRNRLIAEGELYRGTLSRAAVEPRGILKECLRRSASGLILFHTHPSGDPTPSVEDLEFTKRLGAACELIGVRLWDHLILGGSGSWVSLSRYGAC